MTQPHWHHIGVVIVDPFRKEQLALRKATAIARRCGARLTLLNNFMLPQPTPDAVLGLDKRNIRHAIRQRRAQLEKLAAPLVRQGLATDCVVNWDFPVQDAIVRQVLKIKPDLLVAESHRHGRLMRVVLANTDWELIRHCPCPLWFVRTPTLPTKPKVLVAVDPRHTHDKPARLDDRLLASARSLADQLGGKVSVVHAYDAPLSGSSALFIEPMRLPLEANRSAQFVKETTAKVNTLAERHGVAARDRHVLPGDAAAVLHELVQSQHSDVLLMGAVSRRLLQQPFIGNTAEKVIDAVDCDVFVVKPAGFKTSVSRSKPQL